MPGGVNSPVRAFAAVGADPIFIQRAQGSHLYGEDGREYLDYMLSWGPLILGHARPEVIHAVSEAASRGLSFGACHEDEIRLAELITEAMPHIQMLRLVNSGTEATMSAVRLARAATKRDKILKFKGCYHGHADSFLISAGSGALTHGVPSSPGVTAGAAADTLLADYNDLASAQTVARAAQGKLAAIIVEPVAGNMGLVPPAPGFLQGLRTLCDECGALLIFDEVITGFRLGYGGASEMFGVRPDLTTLGKIIGGGLPVGAYGGRRELMELVSPSGPVYQAGTLSGNPVSCAAGIATLKILRDENPYTRLAANTAALASGMRANLKAAGIRASLNQLGSAFTIFFGIDRADNFAEAMQADTALYARYFRAMLAEGIYLPPAQFEACFLSLAHDEADIAQTLTAQWRALSHLSTKK